MGLINKDFRINQFNLMNIEHFVYFAGSLWGEKAVWCRLGMGLEYSIIRSKGVKIVLTLGPLTFFSFKYNVFLKP